MCFEAVHPERQKGGSFKEADQSEVADTSKQFLSRSPPSDREVTVNPDESLLCHEAREEEKEEGSFSVCWPVGALGGGREVEVPEGAMWLSSVKIKQAPIKLILTCQ
ncbi:hypothetical protein EXN66_Car003806 [Channa argus]|uniref:Uncharacterized protein n=1 Tax=Channa argus TaxID=215402 RepID=A0A6G1PDD1_CHAAH|nr:hypothetical protein EXN66_Car003806 [Channa argus]